MNRIDTLNIFKGKNKLPFFRSLYLKEISLLLIVGAIGCVGTLFIFNKAWISYSGGNLPQHMSNIAIPQCEAKQKVEKNYNSLLTVNGNLITNQEIEFSINNFNPRAEYYVTFGDGEMKTISSETFVYDYPKAGTYPVKMKIFYKNNASEIFETTLKISPEANVLASSTQIK